MTLTKKSVDFHHGHLAADMNLAVVRVNIYVLARLELVHFAAAVSHLQCNP